MTTATTTGLRCSPYVGIACFLALLTTRPLTAQSTAPVKSIDLAAIQQKIEQQARELVAETTAQLKDQPQSLRLYSQRGDANFFLGQFAAAVHDYDKMVELQPEEDAGHWRRGIAYFYAGKYAQAAGQFERYHSFDNVDRENGIWRYLSQTKAYGRDKAREGLLKYEKDDREPFPAVYELFAGRTTPTTILSSIADAEISPEEREKRLFYSHLYIGLNEAIEGRPDSAKTHLEQAVANTWGPKAGYGPHYMWQVGRLHLTLLTAKKDALIDSDR